MSKSDQGLLKDYMDKGEYDQAARFLEHLNSRSREMERRYNAGKSSKSRSECWQITRSHASQALKSGEFDDPSLLSIHLRSAFEKAEEGESLKDRQMRAIEIFDACLDAAKGLFDINDNDYAKLADCAVDFTVRTIREENRFPNKAEVITSIQETTGLKVSTLTEGTRILKLAHLTFLPKKVTRRSSNRHGMKAEQKGLGEG